MKRNIIVINQQRCNGCGICAEACHEGAIGMVDGKAQLLRDDYCDGLGDCLPACPTGAISFEEREASSYNEAAVKKHMQTTGRTQPHLHHKSQLNQWPVQIQLVPVQAPYFQQANLLIAADCTAFSYANFHEHFMKNHITLIGCPKLDPVDYSDKLTEILSKNEIKSVSILRMEVPCCKGIEYAAVKALEQSQKEIPWRVVVVSTDGELLL